MKTGTIKFTIQTFSGEFDSRGEAIVHSHELAAHATECEGTGGAVRATLPDGETLMLAAGQYEWIAGPRG